MFQPETAPKYHFEKLNHRLLPPFWSSSHITSRAQCSKSASTQVVPAKVAKPEGICKRRSYVFESHFSAGKI